MKVASSPPANANRGINKVPAKTFNAGVKEADNTKTKEAPKAAPELVPINPGSTIGFLKSPCINTPDADSIAPVTAHNSTRGKRNCQNTP